MARLYSIADARKGSAAEEPKKRGVRGGGAPKGRMAAQRQVAGRIARLYKKRSKNS